MFLNSILLGIFGGQEIIVVLIIVVLLFGGKKIRELMRGLGKGMNEFKKAKDGIYEDLKDSETPKQDPKQDEIKKEEKKD